MRRDKTKVVAFKPRPLTIETAQAVIAELSEVHLFLVERLKDHGDCGDPGCPVFGLTNTFDELILAHLKRALVQFAKLKGGNEISVDLHIMTEKPAGNLDS